MHGKQCDAEMKVRGSDPWRWKACKRKPTARILSKYGVYLEYCPRHHNHATKPESMTPATFAKLEPILEARSEMTGDMPYSGSMEDKG